MSSYQEVESRQADAEKDLAALDKELAWELSKAAVDAAGVLDPSPISDGVGAAMSLADGDLIGAGLSLISMVPYLGDAIGKTAKGARVAAKLARLRKKIAAVTAEIEALKKARKAAETAAQKAAAAAKKIENSSPVPCTNCPPRATAAQKSSGKGSTAGSGGGGTPQGSKGTGTGGGSGSGGAGGGGKGGGGGPKVHSKYEDGTPVYEGKQPDRLPSDGNKPLPDPDATGPHSVLRWDKENGRVYQAREFDAAGNPVRDVDFTSPTFTNGKLRPDHAPAPHQHPWKVNDPKVGPKSGWKRDPGESLK